MFFEKNREHENKRSEDKKEKYNMDYEFLAVPEIHTGKVKSKPDEEKHDNITYDTVAVPEVHVHREKNK